LRQPEQRCAVGNGGGGELQERRGSGEGGRVKWKLGPREGKVQRKNDTVSGGVLNRGKKRRPCRKADEQKNPTKGGGEIRKKKTWPLPYRGKEKAGEGFPH